LAVPHGVAALRRLSNPLRTGLVQAKSEPQRFGTGSVPRLSYRRTPAFYQSVDSEAGALFQKFFYCAAQYKCLIRRRFPVGLTEPNYFITLQFPLTPQQLRVGVRPLPDPVPKRGKSGGSKGVSRAKTQVPAGPNGRGPGPGGAT
jgi:hypothetical protein